MVYSAMALREPRYSFSASMQPMGRVGTRWQAFQGPALEARRHAGKLPLALRMGVLMGGALLGWAVPIAIASRILS